MWESSPIVRDRRAITVGEGAAHRVEIVEADEVVNVQNWRGRGCVAVGVAGRGDQFDQPAFAHAVVRSVADDDPSIPGSRRWRGSASRQVDPQRRQVGVEIHHSQGARPEECMRETGRGGASYDGFHPR